MTTTSIFLPRVPSNMLWAHIHLGRSLYSSIQPQTIITYRQRAAGLIVGRSCRKRQWISTTFQGHRDAHTTSVPMKLKGTVLVGEYQPDAVGYKARWQPGHTAGGFGPVLRRHAIYHPWAKLWLRRVARRLRGGPCYRRYRPPLPLLLACLDDRRRRRTGSPSRRVSGPSTGRAALPES